MSASADPPSPASSSGPPSPVDSVPAPAGLVLSPFRALRYDPAVAGDLPTLTSPPYDVIDAAGVAALEGSSDNNVIRLILPRDSNSDTLDRYARAAQTLRDWRERGVLRPDPVPALYVYEQTTPDGHAQRGLVGAVGLVQPGAGIVLPHENTMAGPVSDRLALYEAVEADLEPIFLVYDGGGAASAAVATADEGPALVDARLPDGLRHRLWSLTDAPLLAAIAEDLFGRRAVIADGHHRYATYLQRQAAQHRSGAGPGPWDFGLTFLVDASAFGPVVHPIHRVVPGRSASRLAAAAAHGMRVTELDDLAGGIAALNKAGAEGPAFLVADDPAGPVHLLSHPDKDLLVAAMPSDHSSAWRALDVSVLHHYVVGALWDLPDTVDNVGYAHGIAEALAAARTSAGSAVLLNATPVGSVTAVAASGERMPRKSTLFTPKPATGLMIRDHRDA
jgi:uncharacterized protein (DUF1015 family)